MISHFYMGSQSTMVSERNTDLCCIKLSTTPFVWFRNTDLAASCANATSKMPFGRFQSVPSTTGYSCSNGKKRFTSIFSFLSVCARHHSSSICLEKVYIGYSNHLVTILFTISMTSFFSMIQIPSSSVISLRTLASRKT